MNRATSIEVPVEDQRDAVSMKNRANSAAETTGRKIVKDSTKNRKTKSFSTIGGMLDLVKTMPLSAKIVLAVHFYNYRRLNSDAKKLNKYQEQLQGIKEEANRSQGGDIVANAISRVFAKEQEEKIKKLQKKLEKRNNRAMKNKESLGSMLQGISYGANTIAQKSTAAAFAGDTRGAKADAIVSSDNRYRQQNSPEFGG